MATIVKTNIFKFIFSSLVILASNLLSYQTLNFSDLTYLTIEIFKIPTIKMENKKIV